VAGRSSGASVAAADLGLVRRTGLKPRGFLSRRAGSAT